MTPYNLKYIAIDNRVFVEPGYVLKLQLFLEGLFVCCGAPFLSVLNTKSKWLSVDHPNGEKKSEKCIK